MKFKRKHLTTGSLRLHFTTSLKMNHINLCKNDNVLLITSSNSSCIHYGFILEKYPPKNWKKEKEKKGKEKKNRIKQKQRMWKFCSDEPSFLLEKKKSTPTNTTLSESLMS